MGIPSPWWADTPPASPIYIPIDLFAFLSDDIGWLAIRCCMGEFLFDSTGERGHRSGVMGTPSPTPVVWHSQHPGGLTLPQPLQSTYL